MTYFQAPAQNFVFAAKDGTIAYRANGLIPIRKQGDGTIPEPGWTDAYEWKGYIPWDQLPAVVNPKEGFIATANNKVIGDNYPYHITDTWAQPYREERIKQVLSSKNQLSVKDMMALQFDQHNLQAEEFMPIFLKQLLLQKYHWRPIDQQTYNRVKNWNDIDSKDQATPLVFNLWMNEIGNVLFEKDIPKNMEALFDGKAQTVDQLLRRANEGNPGPWIRDAGGLDKVVFNAFQRAVDDAAMLQGDNPADWKWGNFHKVAFTHPLSAIKPLNWLFNFKNPIPIGGSSVTVGAAGWNPLTGEVNHGAAWRTVVDLQDLSKSYNVVGPGESGQVLSSWYQNQMQDWATGKYHVTDTNPSHYEQNAAKLTLTPN